MGTYIPNTRDEQLDMLKSIGYEKFDDLFINIPREVYDKDFKIPYGVSELEVRKIMEKMASKNRIFKTVYRGSGAYNHYIPSIVKQITSKEEFLTSYTPYQAEISQGLLQSIFEYQTMICELTGMDVSNASVYDGATAAAEAVIMCKERKRTKVLVSEAALPGVLSTIKTYCHALDMEVIVVPCKNGMTDISKLKKLLDDKTACAYVQQPNMFGLIEDVDSIVEITHEAGAKVIEGCNPVSLAILKTPAEYGVDIAVGEAQPLGLPLSFGGPYIGFMATTEKLVRRLPGRIVGETVDINNKRAYVLTLQAREQHIRREKALSNICSNQALCAQTVAVYLTSMGQSGLLEVAKQSMSKSHYLASKITGIKGFDQVYAGEFFYEFVTTAPVDINIIMNKLEENDILGGYPLIEKNQIIWCVTEMVTKKEMDRLVELLKEVEG
ncbi:MAG TPA: aminomethyl-transferring glycine dehydrogenase subunit GcvPA [Clostridiales bacterium]|nr:aminomethyl-transferring glycine dehydrogenase subunit GcvPA [Clostridiales bacterium]